MSLERTKHVSVDIYVVTLFIQHTDENKVFFVCSTQTFWLSSAPGALSTLVTSVVLYSLTRATLMSREKDETRVYRDICIYMDFAD